jgi:uncharacterized RDD family membrane protein YckC
LTDNAPQEQDQQPTEEAGADLLPRFLARLIDGIIMSFVMFAVIVPIIFVAILGTSGGFGAFGGFGLTSIMTSIVFVAIYIGYYAFLESSRGQTLGKMVMKLKTVGPDGKNPSFEMAAKRSAFYALGIIPTMIGFVAQFAAFLYIAYTIYESPTHTGWHDEFAGGTKVVKIT